MPSSRCRALQQLQDLRLDGDVERGGRLVGDQQVGLVGERHGDHHALPLAAGKLVRIGAEPLLGSSRCRPCVSSSSTRARAVASSRPLMQLHDLADLLLDRVQRIERGHRLLEDDRDLLAADGAHGAALAFRMSLPLEQDLARSGCDAGVGQEPQDRQCRDGLARARFADQRDRLPLGDREGDVPLTASRARRRPRRRRRRDCGRRRGAGRSPSVLPHLNVLRGSSASRTASPTKIEQDQHDRRCEMKRGKAEPRRLQVGLALRPAARRARASPAAGRGPGSRARSAP